METYTKLELEIEYGKAEATARKRKFATVLQGKCQERYDHLDKDRNAGEVQLTGFEQIEYVIVQNRDDTNSQAVVASCGVFTLSAGELAVLPRIGPKAGETYIELGEGVGTPITEWVIIGEVENV